MRRYRRTGVDIGCGLILIAAGALILLGVALDKLGLDDAVCGVIGPSVFAGGVLIVGRELPLGIAAAWMMVVSGFLLVADGNPHGAGVVMALAALFLAARFAGLLQGGR